MVQFHVLLFLPLKLKATLLQPASPRYVVESVTSNEPAPISDNGREQSMNNKHPRGSLGMLNNIINIGLELNYFKIDSFDSVAKSEKEATRSCV